MRLGLLCYDLLCNHGNCSGNLAQKARWKITDIDECGVEEIKPYITIQC